MVSIVTAVRDLERLRQIYVVLVRHGFGELAQRLGLGSRKTKAAALPAGALDKTDDIGQTLEPVPEAEAKHGEEERQQISLPT